MPEYTEEQKKACDRLWASQDHPPTNNTSGDIPEEIKKWISDESNGFSFEGKYNYGLGARDMYRMLTGKGKSLSHWIIKNNESLRSELTAAREEANEYRKALEETISAFSHIGGVGFSAKLAVKQKAISLLEKYKPTTEQ